LLVDDAAELRLFVKLELEESGRFSVVAEAGDGASAAELAELHQPDLVLLDIAMPVQDGLEALPRIRRASPSTRIVMLSAFEEHRFGASALELGASAYVEKGVPSEELVARLAEIMGEPVSP
jgi:DNA-binding NarL/FixJ family response regulator